MEQTKKKDVVAQQQGGGDATFQSRKLSWYFRPEHSSPRVQRHARPLLPRSFQDKRFDGKR